MSGLAVGDIIYYVKMHWVNMSEMYLSARGRVYRAEKNLECRFDLNNLKHHCMTCDTV